jgi:hypothetical protein
MRDAASTPATAIPAPPGSLSGTLYRYLFYDWLFRPANAGSELERAAALRHNRQSAHWLGTYLRRWFVGGLLLVGAETAATRTLDSPLLSALLAVALVLVVVFMVVTAVCWAILRLGPRP